jgi:hypothetical protein
VEHGSVKSMDAAFAKVIDQSFDMRILCHQTLNSLGGSSLQTL